MAAATTRALRSVHHKPASKITAHVRVVRLHAQKLLKLQREIEREAAAVTGANYKEYYDIGYDEHCSMESQRAVDDGIIMSSSSPPESRPTPRVSRARPPRPSCPLSDAAVRAMRRIFVLLIIKRRCC
jgi:hypothetical protein